LPAGPGARTSPGVAGLGKTVQIPGMVSVVAVLVGGTLMGLIGALIAIPVAAALRLLHEVVFWRLDRS
jgi:predicted PurR-regulated permease PerM